MKIGITERGDASIDYSWVEKLKNINDIKGAVIITKNITDKFIENIIDFKNRVILHVTCTGYGGTILEPNIPTWKQQIENLNKLLDNGFDPKHVVIRIDPIIPTKKGLIIPQQIIDSTCKYIRRYRISIIDMYKHVWQRFIDTNIPSPYANSFYPSEQQLELVDDWLFDNQDKAHFEGCAEHKLKFCEQIGCVSDKDLDILGIENDNANTFKSTQRAHCLCSSYKHELLNQKTRCPYGCLYCYWKG